MVPAQSGIDGEGVVADLVLDKRSLLPVLPPVGELEVCRRIPVEDPDAVQTIRNYLVGELLLDRPEHGVAAQLEIVDARVERHGRAGIAFPETAVLRWRNRRGKRIGP